MTQTQRIAPADFEYMVAAPVGPRGKLAGSHVSDLTDQAALVLFCEFCNPKFNPKKNRYEIWRRETYVRGLCDGCGQLTLHGSAFIHQATHDLVGDWESRPARRGRWGTR